MKKALCLGILLLILLLSVCASAEETTTLMVYLCGNNLSALACEDLLEMMEAETGNRINVVVLAGGSENWDTDGVLKDGSRTLLVLRDGDAERLEDWGQKSMGSVESLEEFLHFGLTEYPAERTIAVLWDHGCGSIGGVCFDEVEDEDGLTLAEINEVFGNLQASVPDYHINILGCDACLMGTYEMAALLSRYPVDYYLASEELVTDTGLNYTDLLETLENDPDISDEDLCRAIIDSYMETCLAEDPDDVLTFSAVKLSEMGALESSMEDFAAVMTGQLRDGNLASVRRGRSRLYTFGGFNDGSWDMVDMGAALNAYAQFDSDKAAEAKRNLSKAVVENQHTENLGDCCGLSILIPQDTAEEFNEYQEGFDISEIIPNWVGFVNEYVSMLAGGSYHISGSGVWQSDADSIQTGGLFSTYANLFDEMWWDEDAECYETAEIPEAEIEISEGAQGFTAVLSEEDLANLDYVEGVLMMDISDDEMTAYVDFGTMQNNLVDWQTGRVVSLFDGTWPVFGGQPVPLYDQVKNEHSRRSLIPVKLNGEYTYLVAVFPAGSTEGRIVGANAGYDENGLPLRNMTKLKDGDEIIPVYTMYYAEPDGDDILDAEFEGERIVWKDGMTVTYESMSDDEEPLEAVFCFAFNDIFGDYTLSEMISFEL